MGLLGPLGRLLGGLGALLGLSCLILVSFSGLLVCLFFDQSKFFLLLRSPGGLGALVGRSWAPLVGLLGPLGRLLGGLGALFGRSSKKNIVPLGWPMLSGRQRPHLPSDPILMRIIKLSLQCVGGPDRWKSFT